MKQKIVVAVGGHGGSLFAKTLLDALARSTDRLAAVGVVMTDLARSDWEQTFGYPFAAADYPTFTVYGKKDFLAPFASGSAMYHAMIVCPCPLGLLGRVTAGVSDDLITRATDVMLKERRRLIVVPHEAPYNLIHLRNMVKLTEAGAVVCPAVLTTGTGHKTHAESVQGLTNTILSLAGISPAD